MKIVTQKDLVASVADRFYQNYQQCLDISICNSIDKTRRKAGDVLASLRALPADATAEDVTAIIGNSSWTELDCDQCDSVVTRAVHLGEEPDHESTTFFICGACLAKAAALIAPEVQA